jgi:hypothetical protein
MGRSETLFPLVFWIEGRLERLLLDCMFAISFGGELTALPVRPVAAVGL